MRLTLSNIDNNVYNCSKIYEDNIFKYYQILKQQRFEKVKEICEFIKENGRNPSKIIESEKQLFNQLFDIKKLKKESSELYYDGIDDILEEYGMINLFDVISKKDKLSEEQNKLINICKFKNIYNKYPSVKSTDEYEKKLANSLTNLKRKFKKNTLYESYKDDLKEFNCEDMFLSKKDIFKLENIKDINTICEIYNNGELLSVNDTGERKRLFSKICNFKTNLKNNKLDKYIIDEFIKYNCGYILEKTEHYWKRGKNVKN